MPYNGLIPGGSIPQPEELIDGACVGIERPDAMMGATAADRDVAARLCQECPVKQICSEYAIKLHATGENRLVGVWGGRYYPESGASSPRMIGPRVDLPKGVKHGSRTGYSRFRCRCLACSDENARICAEYKARKKEAATHG